MKISTASRRSATVLAHGNWPASDLPTGFSAILCTVWFQQVGVRVEHCYRELMACLFVHNLHIHNTSGKKRGSATPLKPYRKVRRNAVSPIGAGLPSFQGLRSFLHSCEIKSGSCLRKRLVSTGPRCSCTA